MKSKKIISLGLAGCLLLNCTAFAAPLTAAPQKTLTAATQKMKSTISIKTIKATENQEFSILLDQNASTGYSWSYKANTGTIKLISKKVLDKATNKLVGSGNQCKWTFQATKRGNYDIVFSYSRGWDKNNTTNKTVKYKISVTEAKNNTTQIPNPLVEFKTIADAQTALGFSFAVPALMEDYKIKSIHLIAKQAAQILYTNDSNSILYRTAKGADDISGDYNVYDTTKILTITNKNITCKGSNEGFKLALWSDGTYTYSLSFQNSVSENDLTAIIPGIQ
jgi:predicted secreted protein/uncharacterized protein YbcV (DUF1398 family)